MKIFLPFLDFFLYIHIPEIFFLIAADITFFLLFHSCWICPGLVFNGWETRRRRRGFRLAVSSSSSIERKLGISLLLLPHTEGFMPSQRKRIKSSCIYIMCMCV
jgi:hypothetical protein